MYGTDACVEDMNWLRKTGSEITLWSNLFARVMPLINLFLLYYVKLLPLNDFHHYAVFLSLSN